MNVFLMQNSIVRPLGRDMQNVLIGFVGEHEARTFFVRTRDDLTGYTVGLVIDDVDCGAMTKAPMPDGSIMLSLTLTSDMLGKGGDKVCQLLMTKDAIVRKSSQFRAYVGASNDINSTAPDSATTIIISEKITELVHEAALDAIAEVQEVIDSIPADYSELSDQVEQNTEDIGGLKADLGALETEIAGIEAAAVPTSVRQAICALFERAPYTEFGLADEMNTVRTWASEATAIALDTDTASISGSGTVQLVATTTPSGLPVLWSSSDPSVATVSDTGLVSGVNNGTATITAISGVYSATCEVTVSGFATLTGITAVYTQSGEVKESTSLDSLKSDLVVTATYSDSTTMTVSSSAYTLSGTLTTGTSTITVSYGGKTTTFNVTVTGTTLLNNWDFTVSLTDTVGGVTATAQQDVIRDQTGLVFPMNKNYAYVDFGETYGRNRTYEVDVLEIQPNAGSSLSYRRFLMFDTDSNTGGGGAGLICCRSGGGKNGWYFYLGTGWDSAPVISGSSSDFKEDIFDGKTVKIYLDADGYAHLYTKTIGANDSTYEYISDSGAPLKDYTSGHVYFGSSGENMIGPAVFTGFRVYGGEK